MHDAPIVGDTPALDLANTHFAIRGKPVEGLPNKETLERWLTSMHTSQGLPPVSAADSAGLASFIELRDAIRVVAQALIVGGGEIGDAVDRINDFARANHTNPRLVMEHTGLIARSESDATGMRRLLAEFAWDAIDLFGTERKKLLRSCPAPDCPLFFIKDHSRRKWCRPSCANRVRAARAYRKQRGTAVPGSGVSI
ncbi:CGNR zinc finger domain-containing protein [Streptomyces sp. NPDC002573]|uniref:CGNR zinc finger domain-containing protein n=1 Tax=Streptomyces sp. NPDC002573 TaxID=3364651 RepID=UPI0036CF703C